MPTVSYTIEAIDQASATAKAVGDNITTSTEKVNKANKDAEVTSTKLMTAFNNIATAGFSLYQSYDRIQNSQLALDKANITVKTTTEALERAQTAYNAAVAKYGINSNEAKQASDALTIAQDKYSLALDRAEQAQQNVGQTMVSSVLGVIPTAITMITGLKTVTDAARGADELWQKVKNMDPTYLIIAAIIALVAILITAYETCEPFRNAINAIGAALLNLLKPFQVVIDAVKALVGWFGSLFSAYGKAYTEAAGAGEYYNPALWKYKQGVAAVTSMQAGGIIPYTGLFWMHTGETVTPAGGRTGVTIQGPLLVIEGSADKRTAEMAVNMMKNNLKSILLEASSSGAPSVRKRIRVI